MNTWIVNFSLPEGKSSTSKEMIPIENNTHRTILTNQKCIHCVIGIIYIVVLES